jgi:hypothetical protein
MLLTNVRLLVKRTVFIRSSFNAWQQVKKTRVVTTIRKKMSMEKRKLFGKHDNFNKYSVLVRVCKLRYFKLAINIQLYAGFNKQ